jgi:hypothetical protein
MSIKIGKFIIRPELERPLYWLHLGVIAIVVLLVLEIWKGGDMFTIKNVLYSIPLIGLGDIISHTLLKLN